MAEIGLDARDPVLGDDLTVPVLIKAVDHDPVETGLPPHRRRQGVTGAFRRTAVADPFDAGPNIGKQDRGLFNRGRRLEFDQHQSAVHADHPLQLIGPVRMAQHGAQRQVSVPLTEDVVQRLGGGRNQEVAGRTADHVVGRQGQGVGEVVADRDDGLVRGAQDEQIAVRLDRAGTMNGFAGAGVLVGGREDGVIHGRHSRRASRPWRGRSYRRPRSRLRRRRPVLPAADRTPARAGDPARRGR